MSRAGPAGVPPVKRAPRWSGGERPNEVSAPAAGIVPPPVSGGGRECVPPRVLSVLCCLPLAAARPLSGPQKPARHQVDEPVRLLPSRTQRVVCSSLFCLHLIAVIFLDSQSSCMRLDHLFIFLFFPPHFCHSAPVSDGPEGSEQLFVPCFFFSLFFLLLVFAQCPVPLFFPVFSNL